MKSSEFLDLYIFKDLKSVNYGFDTYFSQEDFEVVLLYLVIEPKSSIGSKDTRV